MRDSVKKVWIANLLANPPAGPMGQLALAAVVEFRGQYYLATEKLDNLIQKAGYKRVITPKENGCKVEVYGPTSHTTTNEKGEVTKHTNPEGLVAAGYDSDFEEALAAALFGAWREEQADAAIDRELTARGIKVDDNLRIKLQQRYIQEGGEDR